MASIFELKEESIVQTPLLLFDLLLKDGVELHWSTHRVTVEDVEYEARVMGHNLFEMRADAEEGIDGLPKLTLALANADSFCSQIERTLGWRGSRITVRLVLYDLLQARPASNTIVVFRGTAASPEEITETQLRLSFSSHLNLKRILLPAVRIQKRCPWRFPATAEQRQEALNGGIYGKYSPFYKCGYSAGLNGGFGNLTDGVPFTSCDYTRAQCEERGMFDRDQAGRVTRRFGGVEFVPPTIVVRSHGEKGTHWSPVTENEARYNDFVPMVYGTAWFSPPVVFARNDGNLTRMEVLLGMGEIQDVLKVLVNDVEIPLGREGADMTGTGWYKVVSRGTRNGAFNLDFTDGSGRPLGDPYGSMAYLSVVVPKRINDGRSLPKVQVLLQGLKIPRFREDGTCEGEFFDNNPAWVVLDLLLRAGWKLEDLDMETFARTAAHCAQPIEMKDLYGNLVQRPRYQTNLVLRKRRSLADVIRGIRVACGLYLAVGHDGRLQLRIEGPLAQQQPVKPAGSNAAEPLNGGWPAYEFGDGTGGKGGILRKPSGEPAIRFWSRTPADTPNRLSVEFQDEFNDYQQDSLSLLEFEDAVGTGQEISAVLPALGIPNFHQAARALRLALAKSVRGNTYVELETSVKGLGLRPGDIITLTYPREGFFRQPFRIVSVAPRLNYRTVTITAQIHSDEWYSDEVYWGPTGLGRQPSAGIGIPRPILGVEFDEEGLDRFKVEEAASSADPDSGLIHLRVHFISGRPPGLGHPGVPKLSLWAEPLSGSGSLQAGQVYYYGVTCFGSDGQESSLSFLVRADIPADVSNHYAVRLHGLSFPHGTTGFHVYRGVDPLRLFRIATVHSTPDSFLDPGFVPQAVGAPDENYDHANFYWRFEMLPEVAATIWSKNSIGNHQLSMLPDEYRGMRLRITEGKGRGQERTIIANSSTELTVDAEWLVIPDASSRFVVAEGAWRYGATGKESPAEFEVPLRPGATVHITGHAANVNNQESVHVLSPLTRHRIGGGGSPVDTGVPRRPVFGLAVAGQGTVEVGGIGFPELVNTRTISAGLLALYFWPERDGASPAQLAEGIGLDETRIKVLPALSMATGELLQVGGEVMRVVRVIDEGSEFEVERGFAGGVPQPHEEGAPVFRLDKRVFVLPFQQDFFGSPASGSYTHSIYLPNVRIVAAQLTMRNKYGVSEPAWVNYAGTRDLGLRSLAGGQIVMQVQGYLAVQADAGPLVSVEETRSVRDVIAIVRHAPRGQAVELLLRQDGVEYCRLTIPEGQVRSQAVDGLQIGVLRAGSVLSLDILSVPAGPETFPGEDLTVTIRL